MLWTNRVGDEGNACSQHLTGQVLALCSNTATVTTQAIHSPFTLPVLTLDVRTVTTHGINSPFTLRVSVKIHEPWL